MDYASGVWGYRSYNKPNNVHNRAQRAFLGVHRFTSNVVVNGDMGWTPPNVRRKLDILRLWYRLDKMQNSRLTKRIYLWDKCSKANNWSRDCKRVLQEANLFDMWDNNTLALKDLLQLAKSNLMDLEIKKWQKDLFSQNKLRTYRLYKTEYGSENYVMCNLSKSVRSFIAKIRSSTLPLRIETGRFEKLKEEERLCKFCNTVVENEYHFIFECHIYNHIRISFISNILTFHPDFMNLESKEKWKIIMCDNRIVPKLGKYICDAFYYRNKLVYNHQ